MARFRPLLCSLLISALVSAQGRPLEWRDVMQFRSLQSPQLSKSGTTVCWEERRDRGDGAVVARRVDDDTMHRIERGTGARLSTDGRWLACRVAAPFGAAPDKNRKPQIALLDVTTGATRTMDGVTRFAFLGDSTAIVCQLDDGPGDKPKRTVGATMVVQSLTSSARTSIYDVHDWSVSEHHGGLVYAIARADGQNSLAVRFGKSTLQLDAAHRRDYHSLTWRPEARELAWVANSQDDSGEHALDATLWHWQDGGSAAAIVAADALDARVIAADGTLRFGRRTPRLFFDTRHRTRAEQLRDKPDRKPSSTDPLDIEHLLADRGVDVWHYRDDRIVPHQKKVYARLQRQTQLAVHHLDRKTTVVLASDAVPDIDTGRLDGRHLLGSASQPYLREMTWDGRYRDVYAVDALTGDRRQILTHQGGTTALSPDGRTVVAWADGHWHLIDLDTGARRTLTAELGVPFANEDHDYPSDVPGYGVAGWTRQSVLLYDKYDLWEFPVAGGPARCVTAGHGRRTERTFRIVDTTPDERITSRTAPLLLSSLGEWSKQSGFWRVRIDEPGLTKLIEEPKKFDYVSSTADRLLWQRQDYDEFPDLWIGSHELGDARQLSNLDTQRQPFAWGTSELVEWRNADGRRMQGALIKPEGWQPGQRLPVLVYYYRFFAQRVHEFNAVVINHRPCFPFYASHGYAVFLPDIRFDIGNPGYAATKCLVPGVQKLIDMGIADPEAICLHGHSWSGYQTAHVITQTDLFACAIAGAPVSNMTSAYGGIRWGSGLSRQFQYEKTQSRIGADLWERRDLYIDNSPVFFADRINTPLLIQFGDEDGAVPWYQGIELYMAMRRLDKECVFLQYRGEPHHLQRYANKLDYSIKFKSWVDHYCKGEPAPAWISRGAPYSGK